jgi:hypothetical protein
LTCLEWHKQCPLWPSPGFAVTCRTAARDRLCRPPREGQQDPRAEAVQAEHPHAGGSLPRSGGGTRSSRSRRAGTTRARRGSPEARDRASGSVARGYLLARPLMTSHPWRLRSTGARSCQDVRLGLINAALTWQNASEHNSPSSRARPRVHSGVAGERVHDIGCSARPGTAPSAILSRVQTFMLMTIPMISRISSREKCSASASCRTPKPSATVASATRVIASV